MKNKVAVSAGIFLLQVTLVLGQSTFVWQPVTDSDWAVSRDSSKGIRDAAMLFEHIVSNEKKFNKKECYYRVYRRIRILGPEGRKWADVSLAVAEDESEIRSISGRTVLRDGRIVELDPQSILEKEIMKSDDFKMIEKSFSLPGVSDDCIIEYCYESRSETNTSLVVAQKDIPVLDWEFRWKFFANDFGSFDFWLNMLYGLTSSPNYLWMNSKDQMTIETLPRSGEPEEVVFRIRNIPAFQAEEYSPPEDALRATLRVYYGSGGDPATYWSGVSDRVSMGLSRFFRSSDRVKSVAAQFSALSTPEEKSNAIFSWIRENFKNVSTSPSKDEFDENHSIDDLLDHKYGTQQEMAFLFYGLLKELNVDAFVVFVPNRSEQKFVSEAKYWQFDRPLVIFQSGIRKHTFYFPGDMVTAPGRIPWYYEGTKGLLVGVGIGSQLFVEVPTSKPEVNAITRTVEVQLAADEPTLCRIQETLSGHPAREVRLALLDRKGADTAAILSDFLKDRLGKEWRDSIKNVSIASHRDTVTLGYEVSGPETPVDPVGRIVFRPLSIFGSIGNPFTAAVRKHPIMFDYRSSRSTTFRFLPSQSLVVEAAPPPRTFSNFIGSVDLIVPDKQDTLTLVAKEVLDEINIQPAGYEYVREYYGSKVGLRETTIIFKKSKVASK